MAYKDFVNEIATSSDVNTYLMKQMVIVCTSGTRPSSPQAGMRIWETDTKREMVYDGSTWQTLINKILYVAKSSSESLNNATLQADNDLFLAMEVNTTYIMTCVLIASCTADGVGIKANFTTPAGTTIVWSPFAPHLNQTDDDSFTVSINYFSGTGTADMTCNLALQWLHAEIVGLVRTGGTSGNLQLQWAQSVLNAGEFIGVRGREGGNHDRSYLRLEKVA